MNPPARPSSPPRWCTRHGCAWAVMRFAAVILRVLTDNGVELLTRIAGLLLAAIAVQLVAQSALAFAAQAP